MPEAVAQAVEVVPDETGDVKQLASSKNGKKPEGSSGTSFFSWFMVLALLGVWTSVAVVYFELVDYQGVIGKLASYDADGDGDFDVEDAKVLLDDKPGVSRKQAKVNPLTRDVGGKLREALKQQLALIHERVEAKKIAKLALAEVRNILAKEELEEKQAGLRREATDVRVRERVSARMKEEEKLEELERALERIRRKKEKEKRVEREEGEGKEEEEKQKKKSKKGDESERKKPMEVEKQRDKDERKEESLVKDSDDDVKKPAKHRKRLQR